MHTCNGTDPTPVTQCQGCREELLITALQMLEDVYVATTNDEPLQAPFVRELNDILNRAVTLGVDFVPAD